MQNPFEEINIRLAKIEKLIENINPSPTISDAWMSIDELSVYLPGKPTKAQIYNWTHRKTIPVHKMGKRLSFLKSEIDNWLSGNFQLTKIELEKVAKTFIKNNTSKRHSK